MTQPRDLIDAVRRVMRASRVADMTELDLDTEIAELDALTAKLEAVSVDGLRVQAALRAEEAAERMTVSAAAGTGPLEHARDFGFPGFFPYSPVVGALNPLAPPVEFHVVDDGEWVALEGTQTFDAIYNGPPDGVHGGIIAAVLDELLGGLCLVNDVAGFTGTLSIRYSAITPVGEPIRLRGWIDRVEGRKTFAKGTFHHGETLCAQAEGIFVGFNPFT